MLYIHRIGIPRVGLDIGKAVYDQIEAIRRVHMIGLNSHLFEHERAELIRLHANKVGLKRIEYIERLLLFFLVKKREQTGKLAGQNHLQIIGPVDDKLLRRTREARMKRNDEVRRGEVLDLTRVPDVVRVGALPGRHVQMLIAERQRLVHLGFHERRIQQLGPVEASLVHQGIRRYEHNLDAFV